MRELRSLIARNRAGSGEAMPSVCSAHPDVVAASLLLAESLNVPLLLEATSNQVNQFGGYTGMRPADFIAFARRISADLGISPERLLFGGDHLGPQVWRSEPADSAMAKARDLVAEYVKAGFTKIHLDCSEGCAGEPAQVSDLVSAARAADLAEVCEAAASDPDALSYDYGTEVPPPGGARAEEGGQGIAPTRPENALATIAAHHAAFAARGLDLAWERAVGLVVQPGIEFAPDHVHHFDLNAPDHLRSVLADYPWLSFEAHSTDYQAPAVFAKIAQRNFAVLKVGPALTYAYRQAIYALNSLSAWTTPGAKSQVPGVMEGLMMANPTNWTKHYEGDEGRLKMLRHFSYADRIRYYWTQPAAAAAVDHLLESLGSTTPLPCVLEQFFALAVLDRAEALSGTVPDWRKALIYAQIQEVLVPYYAVSGSSA